jgi:hypothetical protein
MPRLENCPQVEWISLWMTCIKRWQLIDFIEFLGMREIKAGSGFLFPKEILA